LQRLLTGADGYLGWPTALRLADRLDERIVCVDNFARREWVAESGSVSATRIEEPRERFESVDNLSLIEGDLADRDFVLQLLRNARGLTPCSTRLHSRVRPTRRSTAGVRCTPAQQYLDEPESSHGLDECGLDETILSKRRLPGSTAHPTSRFRRVDYRSTAGAAATMPFPAMGGSWYHQTKSFDAANMRLADSQFEFPMSEIRTAIVYGTETDETRAR